MPRGKQLRAGAEPAIVAEIRAAILDSGANAYQLAKRAGIDQAAVRKFLTRERSLSLDSGARIAEALGLKLVRPSRPRKFAGKGREGPTAPAGGDGPSVLGLDRGEASATRFEEAGGVDRHSVPAEGSGGHQAEDR